MFALVLLLVVEARAEQPLAAQTIVIYNRDLPESAELAKFYAQKRGIDRNHLVGLACSKDEEISREEYDTTIAGPLREMFAQRKWWTLSGGAEHPTGVSASAIHFVALIKGVPMKIRAAATYPGDTPGAGPIASRNEASVDSELAVLGRFSPVISGALINPYFQSYRPIAEFENPSMLLVCRLDAASAETVRRMIVDAIDAEKNGLWGRAYIDGGHNPPGGLAMGDDWLSDIAKHLRGAGVPTVFEDTPALFPDGYPMTDCALYYGWYSGNVTGPFTQPGFRFLPGAIAVHIHSFSANTLRDPNANWVAPLLAKGAAASMGNVYEPYLQLTAHLNVFNDRLLHGFTFAESSYMSIQTLSWQNVFVGDPLYRPYLSLLQIDAKPTPPGTSGDWKMYHEFALKNGAQPLPDYRINARQAASRARNAPMIEDLGLTEARDNNFAAAASYFQQARTLYTKRDDILRVVLEESDIWIKLGKPKRALDLVRSVLRIAGDAPAAPLLRKIESDLAPAPKR
ncbi:MAG: hypothetical protein QOI04_2110 [Verrucomicrobiota bacterium]